jgi:hypothetical protein
MMENHYLAKFSPEGKPEGFLLEGVNYKSVAEKEAKIAEGYNVELTQEEWEYYTNNRGMGENGTGYIRDPETGKPVSAPAKVWTKSELADIAANNCAATVDELNQEIIEAKTLYPEDTETIEELEADRDAAEAKYAQQLDDIEAGVITDPSQLYDEEEIEEEVEEEPEE